jgi:hypothetical protein
VKKIMRPLAAVGVGALTAATLAACGGGPPSDASAEDFCAAIDFENQMPDNMAELSEQEDYDAIAQIFDDWADELRSVGTPSDISDEAREGFEIILDQMDEVDADFIEANWDTGSDPFEVTGDDKEKVDAFDEYERETC